MRNPFVIAAVAAGTLAKHLAKVKAGWARYGDRPTPAGHKRAAGYGLHRPAGSKLARLAAEARIAICHGHGRIAK
jgi:hypothetical protein